MRLLSGPLGIGAVALVLLLPGRETLRPLSLHGPQRQTKASVGFLWGGDGGRLTRIDESTLQPVGRPSARLGFVATWAVSQADSRLLAVGARMFDNDQDDFVRFVNTGSLRLVKRTVPLGGWARALLWSRPDRVVALVGRCCTPGTWVVTIDPGARRVVSRVELEGDVSVVARAADALVLLVTPRQQIGPSRLDVVAADGSVRSVALARVSAGSFWPDSSDGTTEPIATMRLPALAVDSANGRAYIVQPDGPAAEIDLASLAVAYHDLKGAPSLLARFSGWLTPPAQAKGANGPQRAGTWLGDGLLAVTGVDERAVRAGDRMEVSGTPAGLAIVDTRDWTIRALDPGADTVTTAEGLLLATGSRWTSDAQEPTGMGLAAYGPDRSLRFRLLPGRSLWVQAALAGRAYVSIVTSSNASTVEVVDLATGRVVDERTSPVPIPLLGDAPVQ
jgi:hypothetical protein